MSEIDEQLTIHRDSPGHFPTIMGHGPDLVTLPKGSSVYPHDSFQWIEQLWRIVQVVAETESEYGRGLDFDDHFTEYYCPYCKGELPASDYARGEPFPHAPSCIVTKARALIEQRKQSPQVTVNSAKERKET